MLAFIYAFRKLVLPVSHEYIGSYRILWNGHRSLQEAPKEICQIPSSQGRLRVNLARYVCYERREHFDDPRLLFIISLMFIPLDDVYLMCSLDSLMLARQSWIMLN